MSYKLYDDADIQDIADAIREKNGSQDTYKVRQMGDAIRAINTSSGLTEEVKQALLDCFAHVAWVDEYGQDYYDALYNALYPPADLTSISCVYTQGGTVFDTATLDSLKSDLVVTAHYSDSSTQTITTYTLSGSLTEGTSTITVLYGGKSTSFTVNVTHWEPITEQITWNGAGSNRTSSIINAMDYDIYWEVPFVASATELKEGVTAESPCVGVRAKLYSDAQATNLVGWWFKDTQTIKEQGTDNASPKMTFNVSEKVAPKGYYVQLYLARELNYVTFVDNASFGSYMNSYANVITKE